MALHSLDNITSTVVALHSLAPWLGLVIPLVRFDDVLLNNSEGVDDVGAQGRVDVLGLELGWWRAILGPVRVVTHADIFPVSCIRVEDD